MKKISPKMPVQICKLSEKNTNDSPDTFKIYLGGLILPKRGELATLPFQKFINYLEPSNDHLYVPSRHDFVYLTQNLPEHLPTLQKIFRLDTNIIIEFKNQTSFIITFGGINSNEKEYCYLTNKNWINYYYGKYGMAITNTGNDGKLFKHNHGVCLNNNFESNNKVIIDYKGIKSYFQE